MGTMLGYVIEAYSIREYNSWKGAFYIQIVLILFSVVLFTMTPDKFFSRHYKRSKIDKGKFNEEYTKRNIQEQYAIPRKHRRYKSFKVLRKNKELEKYSRMSDYSIFSVVDESDENAQLSYLELISALSKNKVYIFTMLSNCCLLFIITGIQFWISDYMQIILKINPKTVFFSFSITCITAPVFGVMWGGYTISQAGGYTNKAAIETCFHVGCIAAVVAILVPMFDTFVVFVLLVWLLLFFGGSIVPGLTGIMLTSLGDYSKEAGNSITYLCYNLFGYLPAPFLYGLICQYTGGNESRMGLVFLMSISILGVVFLFFARKSRFEVEDIILDEEMDLNSENQDRVSSELGGIKNYSRHSDYGMQLKEKTNVIYIRKNSQKVETTFEEKGIAIASLFARTSNLAGPGSFEEDYSLK